MLAFVNQLAIYKPLTEERIIQGDRLDPLHIHILHKLRIDVEEDWHIYSLTRAQPLLLKAETLNLAEVWRHLRRRYTVRRHTDDIITALVRRGVER